MDECIAYLKKGKGPGTKGPRNVLLHLHRIYSKISIIKDGEKVGRKKTMTENINKLTLSEQVYNILKSDILGGSISLGSKLTNRELQERFKVSSTPVRDAINKLNQDGFIKEVTKTGAQLIDFDFDYAKELNEFILSLSCDAIQLSSQGVNARLVAGELYRHLAVMSAAEDDDTYFDADYEFHKVFFDFCGNRFLIETYNRYNLIRYLLMRYAIRTREHRAASIQQHRQIMDAYARQDYSVAQRLMEDHYQHGVHLIDEHNLGC